MSFAHKVVRDNHEKIGRHCYVQVSLATTIFTRLKYQRFEVVSLYIVRYCTSESSNNNFYSLEMSAFGRCFSIYCTVLYGLVKLFLFNREISLRRMLSFSEGHMVAEREKCLQSTLF